MKKVDQSDENGLPSDDVGGNASAGEPKRKGGAKTSRSETVTVRLDPMTRYLAEIAARIQHQTLSSFIDSAVSMAVNEVRFASIWRNLDEEGTTIADMAPALWDVDPAERFVRLAILNPYLLTHDEQMLWKIIGDSGVVKPALFYQEEDGTFLARKKPDWYWLEHVGFPRLRDHWETLVKISAGELSRANLPKFNW